MIKTADSESFSQAKEKFHINAIAQWFLLILYHKNEHVSDIVKQIISWYDSKRWNSVFLSWAHQSFWNSFWYVALFESTQVYPVWCVVLCHLSPFLK